MNNTEAKFILSAYRPGGGDAADKTMADALAQAKSDPALAQWLARSQAHDAAVADKLREVPVPAGLREAILAGARVSGGKLAPMPAQRKTWIGTAWWAAAASVAVMLAATALVWPNRAAAESRALANLAIDDTLHARHGGHGGPQAALQTWLSQPASKLGGDLPVDFAALESSGCREVSLGGHPVLEVCFKREGKWFHCYMVRHEDMPDAPMHAKPTLIAAAGGAAAVWSDAHYHYAVVSDGGPEALKLLL